MLIYLDAVVVLLAVTMVCDVNEWDGEGGMRREGDGSMLEEGRGRRSQGGWATYVFSSGTNSPKKRSSNWPK